MRLPRRDFVGATAVVTGAASGMGEAMAHELATEGADVLVLVDWHAERLGLGSDAVQFAGFVRPADLPARLARAEVHVLTSHHDAAPVAVLEAAACGLATVGTAIGHVTDLAALDPPAAVMVPDRTPEAVAAAIVGLLTDPDARGRIADAARTWVLAHDADRTAHDFEEIYAALRASRRAR